MTNQPDNYRTRYGIMTAPESADTLLYRSWQRLNFLQDVFTEINPDGHGFTLQGYSSQGLATIIEDIAHDVWEAHAYHRQINPTPGYEGESPEVRAS